MIRTPSIGRSLTLWFAFSVAFMVVCASLFLYQSLKHSLFLEDEVIINDRIQAVTSILERQTGSLETLKKRVEYEWAERHFEKMYVRVTDDGWNVITETPNTPETVQKLAFRRQYVQSPFASMRTPLRIETSDAAPILLVAMEVRPPETAKHWTVYVALDLAVEGKVLDRYKWRMLSTLLITFLLSILVGRFVAGRGLRPVSEMAAELSTIYPNDMIGRVNTNLPSELKLLGVTFNQLLERIQNSMNRVSQFSADIAHELRTPINNLRGEIEVALSKCRTSEEYEEVLSSCLEECVRMKSVVDSLLFLARAEQSDAGLDQQMLNLRQEFVEITEFYDASSAEAGVRLKVDVPDENLGVAADRTLFRTAIGNLLSNAIRYTPKDGEIRLSGSREGDSTVIVEVQDTGIGIEQGDLPFVFDRLYRADRQRTAPKDGIHRDGFGLGLSIVQAILKIHGGTSSITSQPGHGTRVTLRFQNRKMTDS